MSPVDRNKIQARIDKANAKAVAKVAKRGVNTEGAKYVVDTLSKDTHKQSLVLFDDRLLFVDHGKVAALLQKGGRQEWRYDRITAVGVAQDGMLYSYLVVTGAGSVLRVRMNHAEAARCRREIQEGIDRMHAAVIPANPAASSAADELGKLADLRDRGVLTDEEFAAKKAQILGI